MCFSSLCLIPTFNRQAIISGTSLGPHWHVWASTASWPPPASMPPLLFRASPWSVEGTKCRQNPFPWTSTHYIPHYQTPTISFYALLVLCVWKPYQILKSAHFLICPFPQVTVSPHDFLVFTNLPMDSLCPSQKAKGSLLWLDLASPELRSEIPFVYPQVFFQNISGSYMGTPRRPQSLLSQSSLDRILPRTSFSQMVSLPLMCLFSRVAQNSHPDEINKLLTCPHFRVAKVPAEDLIDPLGNSRYQMLWITSSSMLSITEFREKASCSLFPSKPWISFEITTPCHRCGQAVPKGRPSSPSCPHPGP